MGVQHKNLTASLKVSFCPCISQFHGQHFKAFFMSHEIVFLLTSVAKFVLYQILKHLFPKTKRNVSIFACKGLMHDYKLQFSSFPLLPPHFGNIFYLEDTTRELVLPGNVSQVLIYKFPVFHFANSLSLHFCLLLNPVII